MKKTAIGAKECIVNNGVSEATRKADLSKE